MFSDHYANGQYEGHMTTFSRSSSHAVDLARAIAGGLCLDKLAEERAGRDDSDTARVVDLGSGPGVSLGCVLREAGLVREVVASSNTTVSAPLEGRPVGDNGALRPAAQAPPANDAAASALLSVWCADPFCFTWTPPPSGLGGKRPAAVGGSGLIGGGGGGGSRREATLPTDKGECRLEIVGGGRVHFVSADAIEFLQSCRERIGLLDRVLMKEMVHHVGDYATLGQGLREALRPGTGMALIAGRTPSDRIPWFAQAKRQFAESCMDTERICRALRSLPGLRVTTSEHVFDVHFNLADWCTLLRGRFWSSLKAIGDDDMERGISEVREVYGEDDEASVTFPDHFTFVHVFRDRSAQH